MRVNLLQQTDNRVTFNFSYSFKLCYVLVEATVNDKTDVKGIYGASAPVYHCVDVNHVTITLVIYRLTVIILIVIKAGSGFCIG